MDRSPAAPPGPPLPSAGHHLGARSVPTHPDVLIIGGGINGAGLLRELALQGVKVVLVDKGDFCSGSSAAPSRMIHGGLRYLEYGETRLVRESLRERDALLRNAPHYVRPIETVMPLYSWVKGLASAIPRFVRGKGRSSQRGVVVVLIGLTLYDLFARASRLMPKRSFAARARTLATLPGLDPGVVGSVTYWDAWISYPERLAFELIEDAMCGAQGVAALNYVAVTGRGEDGGVAVRDELSGATTTLHPRIVVNATGGWVDLTNAAMGVPTQRIKGVKGSHLVIDDPALLADLAGRMVYFENSDRRICIVFPWQGKVLAGSTEIPIGDPDAAVCTPEETDYILGSLRELFPGRTVDRAAIVSTFSGVRPLLAGDGESSNEMSRDYAVSRMDLPDSGVPVLTMAGGKWTTFRAFADEAADLVLGTLGCTRVVSTSTLAIGGGRDFPRDSAAVDVWLDDAAAASGLPRERLRILLERYGTRARRIAEHVARDGDRPLTHAPDYSAAEIAWLCRHEHVQRLEDLILRRTNLALLGRLTPSLLDELASIWGSVLGRSGAEQATAVADSIHHIRERFGIDLEGGHRT
jgi:glycerol-3-phosphate dehydrogenase